MIEPHSRRVVTSGRPPHPRAISGLARKGLTATDCIVLLVIVALVVLVLLMVLPRGREHARSAACQNNLAHIGFALAQYDDLMHELPKIAAVAGPDERREARPKSPLRMLLETLEQPSLLGLKDQKTPPERRPGEVPGEVPVAGFVCASDPNATSGLFTAPISYRACSGDMPGGENGAFATGRTMTLRNIQEQDGLSYTAAFSERLVGDNVSNHPAAFNYMILSGHVPDLACPPPSGSSVWRGDAGSSWSGSDYRSTLYNHALPPGGQPSCIAKGGQDALMGASSGHVPGINLLFMDGRVMVVRPSIDAKIWKEFARIGTTETDDPGE